MKIFSENINLFNKKCESFLKQILESEVHLSVKRSRFVFNKYSYPISVAIFESKNTLGQFDHHSLEITLNKCLMFGVKDSTIKDILRHELAHYLCFIKHGTEVQPHGVEFKQICHQYKWDTNISAASLDITLTDEIKEGELLAQKLKKRLEALLNLAKSTNPHEAELATLKANQLILKHNLDKITHDTKEVYTKRILTAKTKNAKMSAIYDILRSFMVKPIFVYGHKSVFLEICGSLENIELAEYIAKFLETKLENLWTLQTGLKGKSAKNSFFLGIASGYTEKFKKQTQAISKEQSKDLVKLEKQLEEMSALVYKRLSSTRSQSSLSADAFNQGKKVGKELNINTALKGVKKALQLTWRNI